jgi:GTPase
VLLHVIDVSNQNFEHHITAVEKILEELAIKTKPTIRVFNKEDSFPDKALLDVLCRRFGAIAVSALHGETLPPLVQKLESLINSHHHYQDSFACLHK